MEITIKDVQEGLPAVIVKDWNGVTTIYDPSTLAGELLLIRDIAEENDEWELDDLQKETIKILNYFLNNLGCITSQAMTGPVTQFVITEN